MKTEIIEGNKLIAEIMELGNSPHTMADWVVIKGKRLFYSELKYHSSWDWLMPVIKKLKGDYKHTSVLWNNIIKALSEVDILKAWEAVVAYIKWFLHQ